MNSAAYSSSRLGDPGANPALLAEGRRAVDMVGSTETDDKVEHTQDVETVVTGVSVIQQKKEKTSDKQEETQEEERHRNSHRCNKRARPATQRRKRMGDVKTSELHPNGSNDSLTDRPADTVTETQSTELSVAAVDNQPHCTPTGGETDSHLLSDSPPVRCSPRLAAKLRRVHCLSSRVKCSSPQSVSPRQTDRQSQRSSEDAKIPTNTQRADPEITSSDSFRHQQIRERRYRCSTCGKRFYQIGHLKKHQFTHTEEKPFTCEECGKKYTAVESFRAHQMSHRGERPFSCPHCDKTYSLKRDLKEHMVLHTGEKPYTCEHCDKSFARSPSLRIHRLLHCSRMTYMQPPKVQCTLCPKLLANSSSLRNHMKLHTGERPHICQHCGKCFTQRGNLESHLRIHSGEKPFPCPECDQTFSQKQDLRRHMFAHSGGGFLCSYCGKSLRDPHSLKSHERLHTGEKPHHCHLCGKGYTLATKLRRHIKSAHVKDKIHTCHCGASYTLRQSLLRHQAQHRKEQGTAMEAEEKHGEGMDSMKQKAAQESTASCHGHTKPVRGRPKRLSQDKGGDEGGESKLRKGQEQAEEKDKKNFETSRTGDGENTSDIQHAVVLVHTDNLPTESSAPLLLTSEGSLSTGQELVEVVISESMEQCIVVHGQEMVGELLILQEEGSGLCSVAQTVEINTV
ncbi:uncharacterized protein KZ484_022849 [Pholidichthys leucotaenia]